MVLMQQQGRQKACPDKPKALLLQCLWLGFWLLILRFKDINAYRGKSSANTLSSSRCFGSGRMQLAVAIQQALVPIQAFKLQAYGGESVEAYCAIA